MPLPSLHPSLPANPTIGQSSYGAIGGRSSASTGPPPSSAAGGGGVNSLTLKGLQDVAWSDDEDDPECLLCAEVLELDDQAFKPCPCGMQICQFCYHKIKCSDAPRCPGCRRPYDEKTVMYDKIDTEEVKRKMLQRNRRAKIVKQLTAMGRRHLLGVRVVMKNMVYVVGMKIPGSGDETISILRSSEYFGQYGKISKLWLRDRPTLASALSATDDAMGICIIYARREDAARAISSLDGIPAPQGPTGHFLKASYGNTRYCEAFLRGAKCDTTDCRSLHEWGGENDCFTKDDMETALTRPSEYDARQKQTQLPPPSLASKVAWPKPSAEESINSSALPSNAGWGKNIVVRTTPVRQTFGSIRAAKISNMVSLKPNSAFPLPTPSVITAPPIREKKKKKELSTSLARTMSAESSSAPNSAAPSPPTQVITLPLTIPPAATPVVAVPAPAPPSVTKRVPPPPPGLGPPPGLSIPEPLDPVLPAELEDSPDEPSSTDSEAGPSSSSPVPETPTRLSVSSLPAPFTDEPICIHSPYEEPLVLSFPLPDPAFEFVLGADDIGDQQYSNQYDFKLSPFDTTIASLAEFGVLAPDLPGLLAQIAASTANLFSGSFQPFDMPNSLESDLLMEDRSGPSKSNKLEEEGPRTTSRFNFARRTSVVATNSRAQSPFAAVKRSYLAGHQHQQPQQQQLQQGDEQTQEWVGNGNGNVNGHQARPASALASHFQYPPQGHDHSQQYEDHATTSHSQTLQRPQHTGDSRASALAAQVASFVGSYGSAGSASGSREWEDQQQYSSPLHGRRILQEGRGGQGRGMRERDDFDPAIASYGSSQQPPPRMFSPESSLHEDRYHSTTTASASSPFTLHSHLQPQSQSQGYEGRMYQQQHQPRTGSPSPLSGYRRF